jgi:hypothetical protein
MSCKVDYVRNAFLLFCTHPWNLSPFSVGENYFLNMITVLNQKFTVFSME